MTPRPSQAGKKRQGSAKKATPKAHTVPEEVAFELPKGVGGRMDHVWRDWELGDWASLGRLSEQDLSAHEDRARLAMLAALGLAQLGRLAEAGTHIRQAQDWGISSELLMRFLISGVLNSLGRAASLIGDTAKADGYFAEALAMVCPQAEATQLGQTRNINEKIALGLLPEAASLMGQSLEQMTAQHMVSSAEAEIFKSQVELINHTLSLAQKRHQLVQSPHDAEPDRLSVERKATSQLGQDLWVLEQTNYKRGGFFVEFGATDGVLLSNSYLLETEFGWKGLCAEPNPAFFRKLRMNRSCVVAPECISGQTGQMVEFILADEFGGIGDYMAVDQHARRRAAYRAHQGVVTLESISLDDFLKKYNAPRVIDYMSVDTEGSEYDILSAFPFDDWDIRLLTIEHNFTPMRQEIRSLLEGHGYQCVEAQWDDWYIKTPNV